MELSDLRYTKYIICEGPLFIKLALLDVVDACALKSSWWSVIQHALAVLRALDSQQGPTLETLADTAH